jgi:hypothetical protein
MHEAVVPNYSSDSSQQQRLAEVGAGEVVNVEVATRTSGGRAARLRVTGTAGIVDIPATRARALLRLCSTWFGVTRVAADAPPGD